MTLQRRDVLIYNGKKYALNCDILKPYFEANPNKKPKKIGFDSSLHRGYFSEFEIINNRLLAIDLRVIVDFDQETEEEISKSVIKSALSDFSICNWYTGTLILFSLSSDIENEYLSIQIKDGTVITVETLSMEEYHNLGNNAYDYF